MGKGRGYLQKQSCAEDGRVNYLSLTEAGLQLSRKYNTDYFQALAPCFDSISEADAECTIRTLERFYQILSERRSPDEKR